MEACQRRAQENETRVAGQEGIQSQEARKVERAPQTTARHNEPRENILGRLPKRERNWAKKDAKSIQNETEPEPKGVKEPLNGLVGEGADQKKRR